MCADLCAPHHTSTKITTKKNRIYPAGLKPAAGSPRQLVQGSCVCCRSYRTLSSVFHPISVDGKINGLPLVLPKIHKEDQQLSVSDKEEKYSPTNRKNKGKEPETNKDGVAPPDTQKKKITRSNSAEQVCYRHYFLNHYVNTAPQQLRDGSCMCCYTHKTNSTDFYTVTNGIVDKFMCPLLLPSTTTHATGVICTKHFVRNVDLYEIYKKSHDIRLECGAFMQPKNEKGEDAYFIGEGGKYLGLADGVGGWAQYNIDPRQFPEKLMEEVHAVFREGNTDDLLEILSNAFENAKHVIGSSTVVITMLDKNDTLRTLNLGDSGFRVIRDFQILYATKEQQHAPNKPFQLGTSCEDTPESGVIEHMKLKAGDVIVFGSDGLFDNLFNSEIIDLIRKSSFESVDKIAQDIALAAHKVSIDKTVHSPYSEWVRSLGNPEWSAVVGGKRDDITVMVARVEQNRTPSNDLSLSHYQSTAMTFSLDSSYLQSLVSQIRWGQPALSAQNLTEMERMHEQQDAERREGIEEKENGEKEEKEKEENAKREGKRRRSLLSLSTGKEEGERKGMKPWQLATIRSKRSLSANGYIESEVRKREHDMQEMRESKAREIAKGGKTTELPKSISSRSWVDSAMRRAGTTRSLSMRELSHALLSQPEQMSTDIVPTKALTNISANTNMNMSTTTHSAVHAIGNNVIHVDTELVLPPTSEPPSPLEQPVRMEDAFTETFLPRTTNSIAHHHLHRNASTNASNAALRNYLELNRSKTSLSSSSGSKTSSSGSFTKGELVAAKPTWRPSGTEQDYFEYMVAMREFEVFVNLHRNTRITILPYFL